MIYSPTDPRLALDHHSLESLCSTCGECGALTDTPEERGGVDLCEECAEDYDENNDAEGWR